MGSSNLTELAVRRSHDTRGVANLISRASAIAVMRAARQDTSLMHTLDVADDMAMFDLMQADWAQLLAQHSEFADKLESSDPYVCDLVSLAEMIAQAPTSAFRQALREVAHCRDQMAAMLDLQQPQVDDRASVVIAGAKAEWDILLAAHPVFEACLSDLDRFTCSRAELADAMLLAPTEPLRHALRETFCFRQIAALTTNVDFE
jgi:hypothetical protein